MNAELVKNAMHHARYAVEAALCSEVKEIIFEYADDRKITLRPLEVGLKGKAPSVRKSYHVMTIDLSEEYEAQLKALEKKIARAK
jgi:hypothetical protein